MQKATSLSRQPKRLGTVGAHRTNQKSKCWLITYNFPPGTKPDALTAQDKLNIRAFNRAAQVHPVSYCVFQGEVGEHGTYHLQAYAEFALPVTMPTIKKHFGINSLHCEIRMGTQEEAIAYCTKEETRASEIHEYGQKGNFRSKVGQGGRNDLERVWKSLKAGKQIADIIDEQPGTLRYVSMMQKGQYEALMSKKRTLKTTCLVMYGAAGTGKTATAISMAKIIGKGYFLMPNDGKAMWWNGYDPLQHDTVILDEFTGSKCPLTFLNQLLDAYDLRVQTKGGFLPFLASHVIITSNFHPKSWYDFQNVEKNLCYEALERRLDTIAQFRLDIHVGLGAIDRNDKKLHIEFEKGGFHRGYITSPFEQDCPPTTPNSPVPLPIPDAPIADRTLSKGKRKVLDISSSEEQPRYRDFSYDSSEEEFYRVQRINNNRTRLSSDEELDSSSSSDSPDHSNSDPFNVL